MHPGILFAMDTPDTARGRNFSFAAAEWDAFGRIAAQALGTDRWGAARAITGDWIRANGWAGTAPVLPKGMTWQQAAALRYLAVEPGTPRTRQEIAAGTGVNESSAPRMMMRLTRDGLVNAEPGHPVRYTLTAAGTARAAEIGPPPSGRIPGSTRRQLDRPRSPGPSVNRILAFTDEEWDTIAAAAAAAETGRSPLIQAVIREWMTGHGWNEDEATAPPPWLTWQTAAILREFLSDPGKARYGTEFIETAGIRPGTVHGILRRLEDAGILAGEQESEHPRGRGVPPRTLYTITPDGLKYAAEALQPAPGE